MCCRLIDHRCGIYRVVAMTMIYAMRSSGWHSGELFPRLGFVSMKYAAVPPSGSGHILLRSIVVGRRLAT
jgi:hypothetical protein